MIRWLIRTAIGFAGLLALAVLVGVLMVDTVARRLLESAIRAQTGLDVRIGKVEVGLIRPTLRVENLKLYSAPSFGGLVMIDMPELFVEYDRASAERRRPHAMAAPQTLRAQSSLAVLSRLSSTISSAIIPARYCRSMPTR